MSDATLQAVHLALQGVPADAGAGVSARLGSGLEYRERGLEPPPFLRGASARIVRPASDQLVVEVAWRRPSQPLQFPLLLVLRTEGAVDTTLVQIPTGPLVAAPPQSASPSVGEVLAMMPARAVGEAAPALVLPVVGVDQSAASAPFGSPPSRSASVASQPVNEAVPIAAARATGASAARAPDLSSQSEGAVQTVADGAGASLSSTGPLVTVPPQSASHSVGEVLAMVPGRSVGEAAPALVLPVVGVDQSAVVAPPGSPPSRSAIVASPPVNEAVPIAAARATGGAAARAPDLSSQSEGAVQTAADGAGASLSELSLSGVGGGPASGGGLLGKRAQRDEALQQTASRVPEAPATPLPLISPEDGVPEVTIRPPASPLIHDDPGAPAVALPGVAAKGWFEGDVLSAPRPKRPNSSAHRGADQLRLSVGENGSSASRRAVADAQKAAALTELNSRLSDLERIVALMQKLSVLQDRQLTNLRTQIDQTKAVRQSGTRADSLASPAIQTLDERMEPQPSVWVHIALGVGLALVAVLAYVLVRRKPPRVTE